MVYLQAILQGVMFQHLYLFEILFFPIKGQWAAYPWTRSFGGYLK